MKRPSTYIAVGLILLALFGFYTQFSANPQGMITSILVLVAVVAIVIFAFKKYSASTNPQQSSYNKAVKQSKIHLQQKQKGTASGKKTNVVHYSARHPKRNRKKSEAHLTVIDGKKGKKNRA
ncbi:SA1362 family protein [Bacillus testis]|uniref:SA1362 family protein n=1 Tax=Bacillus testis TaxID=1622072 RepID=UPI00067EF697|nr:SA1362 family protein [Bacillus testis]